ncbi:hypothetical protein F4778DRAFT_783787 [Xylariomycetidae sp. FL2044]|nr:hypothetical protein F4778DRAFT_783787 [Xylariomycetidae sp. FL2044]
MEREVTSSRAAQYGQACLACFKTKCKCVPRDDGDGCESKKKQNSSDTRIAKLEGKLGHLMSLLNENNIRTGNRSKTSSLEPDRTRVKHHLSPAINPPSELACHDGDEHDEDLDTDALDVSWWDRDHESSHFASPLSPFLSWTTMAPSSAAACLDAFRRHKLHHCPFVHLPPNMTADQLQQDRPFLFSTIIWIVTSSSTAEKRSRALELKRVLLEAVFLQQTWQKPPQLRQMVDLLLSLLVYIAWSWDHIHSGGNLPRLMMLAASLASEMSLERTAPTIGLFDPGSFERSHGGEMTDADKTDPEFLLERQRAVLGCFVLGSAVSAYFSQIEPPRWSGQMEQCLAAISMSSTRNDYISDGTLAFHVRLQLLSMKASQTRERWQLVDHKHTTTLPRSAFQYIKTLMAQLQDLRGSIPPAFQHHVFPLAHTYYTELSIIKTVNTREIASAPSIYAPTRLWYLWQSALAIKSCTSTFLTLSPSELLGISFIQWSQLASCIASLHDLYALGDLGWDLTAVRQLVDLPALLANTAEKLELASAAAGEQSPEGVFAQLAQGMRNFQRSHVEGDTRVSLLAESKSSRQVAGVDEDALMTPKEEEHISNPTMWLDRFLTEHDEQSIST